ncbi:MAG: hypothetical protein J7L71_00515 [Spirochaetaceae bacterium]|nr:hypothetical protein [Spirochaetaceae bacterium]
MSSLMRKILYFLLAFLMVMDFYLIFNAGNPNSFLRILIKDTSYDITVTVVLSILIAIISMMMIRGNDQNSIKAILERNASHISVMKKQNRSDEDIAESFLNEMGAGKLSRILLKQRVRRYISKMK